MNNDGQLEVSNLFIDGKLYKIDYKFEPKIKLTTGPSCLNMCHYKHKNYEYRLQRGGQLNNTDENIYNFLLVENHRLYTT